MRAILILLLLAGLVALALLFASETPRSQRPVAEVNGQVITTAELERAVGPSVSKLQEQIYNLKRDKLEALIDDKLMAEEAARRGLTVEALVAAEVNAKIETITDEEVKTFYEASKARLGKDEPALRDRIRSHLWEQKRSARQGAFLESLRAQAKVVYRLPPPDVYRVEVPVEGAPFRGSATAPVTIVKFEDFHCPYCKQAQPTLSQVLLKYGDRVKLIHRDFPLDTLHPGARRAAEAARCATAQDKFWPYHDLLYSNSPKTDPEQLKAYARQVGLNMGAFEQCVSRETYKEAVQKDIDLGLELGLNGTPSFFINGRLFSGAQPFENFVEVIDQELARAE
ncbi:MAG: thioredoxin domain-containing protein [Candidatus Acidiferrales bacterium]